MGGTTSEARRGDGAKRKSVRKSCRSAGDPAWESMLHHRESATGREVARQHREEIGKNLKSTRKPHTELLVEEGEEDSILFCNFGGKM